MNVIVINGSPRGERSNTMVLTRAFLEGATWESSAWGDAQVIDISKEDVQGCRGCFSCWEKTPGKCIIGDGMCDILPKIIAADIVIWSFPLYSCSFPGKMKCFMDRMLPLALPFMDKDAKSGGHPMRHDLSHQRHFYISTCGFWTADGNYDSIIKMLEHGGGRDHKAFSIFCGQGELFTIPDPELKKLTDAYLEIVRKAGEECASGEISPKTHKRLAQPIFSKEDYESMADGSWEINNS